MLGFNGLLLLSNGIQGEYIARIFEEVKGRPLFVIAGKWGFDESAAPAVDGEVLQAGGARRIVGR
jgi:hypothetical protein